MKIKLTIVAASVLLSACVATNNELSSKNNDASIIPISTVIKAEPAVGTENNTLITLEKIMSDPDWMGRSPQSWYWGDDDHTIFYQQKQLGSPLTDLYRINTINKETHKVKLENLHKVSDRFAVKNSDGSKEAYIFKNNVFIKTLSSGEVFQLTHTSSEKSSLIFLTNGNIAYRIGNIFYQHNLTNNQLIELANLKLNDKPKDNDEPTSYLAKEQNKLIQFIAKQQRDQQLIKQRNNEIEKNNSTVSSSLFYLGEGNEIAHASLSPNGDKMLVSIAKKTKPDASDIMPNYVTSNGHVIAEPARRRVADNREYNERLFLLNLTTGEQTELAYSSLPGFDEDVLASVKKENYARAGKTYKSEKKARNINVLWTNNTINWQENGAQVALMLEAWDNKDRWLVTVDFNNKKLVSQHRLHDDAWINWNFNEFGWLKDNTSLYFLSEQSGYSHLYVKPLQGKAKQITHGQYEVSDVTYVAKNNSFVFKANKKHPGIYEIYQVSAQGDNFHPLTDLGGMNDYQLNAQADHLLIQHSTVTMPPELYVQDLSTSANATQITHTVSEEFLAMPWTAPSVVAIKSTHQQAPIYSKVYLPKNADSVTHKNKAVMFTHGAGYLQNSHLGWSGYFREFMFHSLLTQKGYVVIDMDYRASAGYGRDWRTAIYRHMGKPELEDMRDGVNWLVNNANVDRNKIGTYGGSYGGFLTVMSLFKEPDLFQAGAALRLVSDWAYYNHGYTSNILNTPKDDAIAYEQSSPIYFAQGLQKPLLINAPMVDSNVFFEDSVRLMQRLIELEKKDVEIAIFPVESHGFKQPSSWLHEYRKILKLFETQL